EPLGPARAPPLLGDGARNGIAERRHLLVHRIRVCRPGFRKESTPELNNASKYPIVFFNPSCNRVRETTAALPAPWRSGPPAALPAKNTLTARRTDASSRSFESASPRLKKAASTRWQILPGGPRRPPLPLRRSVEDCPPPGLTEARAPLSADPGRSPHQEAEGYLSRLLVQSLTRGKVLACQPVSLHDSGLLSF